MVNELYSDLAAKTIDGEVLDVINNQPPGSTVTYTFSTAVNYNFALGIGIKLTNNTTAALLINDDGSLVYNRKSGGNWRGWKTAITSSDLTADSLTLKFANGASIVNGSINATNYRAATVTQKYRDTVKNVTLTVQLTASGYVVYARNGNDGSNYNGNLDVHIIAAK